MLDSGIVCLPGMSDGLSARLVEQAGFDGAYLSGGALARGMGYPDLGLVTLTELEQRVRNIAEVCGLPFIVDLDSGFGGALNLGLAVSRIERAGAAGLHIDDFEVPRRSRDPERNLLSITAMQGRFKLAMAARQDRDFVIIGRTDAAAYVGIGGAIDRANAYFDAGVDLVYVEHLHDRAGMEAVAARVQGRKLISLVSGKGETPSAAELAAMGYSIVTWPAECQFGAIEGSLSALRKLREHGAPTVMSVGFAQRDEIVGAPAARDIEAQYLL
jgi:2-methylisocitrate lyase-like PEP mutase family enzyme